MRTNSARSRKMMARNFGDEAKLVRAMPCIVHTAAADSGMSDEELFELGWTACGGAACAHHVHPRQRGGHGEGRMGLFSGCARHGDEAGEASPTKGPSSKRRAFEKRYGVNVVRIADDIALEHEPPLGIRGLAARWLDSRELERIIAAGATITDPGAWESLEGYDLAALMSWTRREADRQLASQQIDLPLNSRQIIAMFEVGGELQMSADLGRALCEQARWRS